MTVPPLSQQRMEQLAEAFNRSYGVKASWSDKQIGRALRDHDLPKLIEMPGYGVGMNAEEHEHGPYGGDMDDIERHRWRRTNAMHMLGHVVAQHPAEAIESCKSCTAINEHIARGKMATEDDGRESEMYQGEAEGGF